MRIADPAGQAERQVVTATGDRSEYFDLFDSLCSRGDHRFEFSHSFGQSMQRSRACAVSRMESQLSRPADPGRSSMMVFTNRRFENDLGSLFL